MARDDGAQPARARARSSHPPPEPRAQVITAEDLRKPVYVPGEVAEGEFARHPKLAGDRVCYVGQPVVVDPERALARAAAILHPKLKTNVAYRQAWTRGRAAPVLAAPPSGSDPVLTVWSSTQMPHQLHDELVPVLPRNVTVRVIAPDAGGGFGAKGTIYPEEFLIPLLAMHVGRPLKWVESRREHLMTTCQGRSQFADVTLDASSDGSGAVRCAASRHAADPAEDLGRNPQRRPVTVRSPWGRLRPASGARLG